MSSRIADGRGFLRAPRMAGTVTLGVDGRPREADDPLSGVVGGTPEETAAAVDLMEEARRRSNELVRRAAREASSIGEEARRAGYDEGYREGAQQARVELAEALVLVQRVARDAKLVRDDLMRRSEHEVIEIVIESLRAILGERAVDDHAIVQATVRRALERAGAQNVVRVRVHPDEADALRASVTETHGSTPPFEVLADGSIGLGGCIVDTRHGRVDARLDTQIDAIARMLREALPRLDAQNEAADAA